MTRQDGGTQYICQNDISLVLPKNSTRMEYKQFINKDSICSSSSEYLRSQLAKSGPWITEMVHKWSYPDVPMLLSELLEKTFQIYGTE